MSMNEERSTKISVYTLTKEKHPKEVIRLIDYPNKIIIDNVCLGNTKMAIKYDEDEVIKIYDLLHDNVDDIAKTS